MKKTLIALAVAGVVAAPAAFAEVTVYGQANVAIANDNNGDASVIGVHSNSSRFGLKAAESLDGGLTAVAQMEFGVGMDDGDTISSRNQFVGLAGGFGTVLAGRHDAPVKMSTGALDIFADTVGDYNAVIGANGATDVRANNAIAYVAPAIAGATIVAAYVPDEKDGTNSDATSLAVMWGQGPLAVDFGYLKTGKDFDLANAAGGLVKTAYAGTEAEVTDMRVGVGYTVSDALKVAFIYDAVKADAGAAEVKVNSMLLNGAFGMGGGNTIKAEFGVIKNDTDGVKDGNGTLMAVGFDHAFSKNTSAYVVYASMANEDAAAWNLGVVGNDASIAPAAGDDPNSLEVGMVVKF